MSFYGAAPSHPPAAAPAARADLEPGGSDVVEVRSQGPDGPRVFEFPRSLVAALPGLTAPAVRFLPLWRAYWFLLGLGVPEEAREPAALAAFLRVLAAVGRELSDSEAQELARLTGWAERIAEAAGRLKTLAVGTSRDENGADRSAVFAFEADSGLRESHPAAVEAGLTASVFMRLVAGGQVARLVRAEARYRGWLTSLLDRLAGA